MLQLSISACAFLCNNKHNILLTSFQLSTLMFFLVLLLVKYLRKIKTLESVTSWQVSNSRVHPLTYKQTRLFMSTLFGAVQSSRQIGQNQHSCPSVSTTYLNQAQCSTKNIHVLGCRILIVTVNNAPTLMFSEKGHNSIPIF